MVRIIALEAIVFVLPLVWLCWLANKWAKKITYKLVLFQVAILFLTVGSALNISVEFLNGWRMPVDSSVAQEMGMAEISGSKHVFTGDLENIRLEFLIDRYRSLFDGGILSLGDLIIAAGLGLLAVVCFVDRNFLFPVFAWLVIDLLW